MAKKKENEEAKKKDNIDLINRHDDDSIMSNVMSMTNLTDLTAYSKDELVEMLKKCAHFT